MASSSPNIFNKKVKQNLQKRQVKATSRPLNKVFQQVILEPENASEILEAEGRGVKVKEKWNDNIFLTQNSDFDCKESLSQVSHHPETRENPFGLHSQPQDESEESKNISLVNDLTSECDTDDVENEIESQSQVSSSSGTSGKTNKDPERVVALQEYKNFHSTSLGKKFQNHFNYRGHVLDGKNNITKLILNCKYCQNSYRASAKNSVSNFRRHIESQHPEATWIKRKSEDAGLIPIKNYMVSKVPKLGHHDVLQKRYRKAILDLICLDNLPLSVTEGDGFKMLINLLNPSINTLSRTTVGRDLETEFQQRIFPSLKRCFTGVEDGAIHLTLDIWTSRMREGILGVRAHFINTDWSLITKTIGFSLFNEKHTGSNIRIKVENIIEAVGLKQSRIGKIVADNAANITKAFEIEDIFYADLEENGFSDDDDDDGEFEEECETLNNDNYFDELEPDLTNLAWDRNRCTAHTLQLAINTALKTDRRADELVKYVTKIIVFFRKSPKYTAKLVAKAKLDLKLPVKTRWNSVLFALERFQNEDVFFAAQQIMVGALSEKKMSIEPPKNINKALVEDLVKILKPLQIATDHLQGDGVTSSLVIPILVYAINKIETVVTLHHQSFKEALTDQIKTRFQNELGDESYTIATVLHPRQRAAVFETDLAKSLSLKSQADAIKLVKDAVDSFEDLNQQLKNPTYNLESINMKETSFYGFIDEIIPKENTVHSIHEVDRYLAEEPYKGNNPLMYWREKEKDYPKLSRLAKLYLSFPASSGDVERLFSIAGYLKRARRAKLSPKKLRQIIFYREYRRAELAQLGKH